MASSRTAQNSSSGGSRSAKNGEQRTAKQRTAYSWTQPVCTPCWAGLVLRTGRVERRDSSHCCFCREPISAGDIYMIRVNPGTVPYPSILKDTQ